MKLLDFIRKMKIGTVAKGLRSQGVKLFCCCAASDASRRFESYLSLYWFTVANSCKIVLIFGEEFMRELCEKKECFECRVLEFLRIVSGKDVDNQTLFSKLDLDCEKKVEFLAMMKERFGLSFSINRLLNWEDFTKGEGRVEDLGCYIRYHMIYAAHERQLGVME